MTNKYGTGSIFEYNPKTGVHSTTVSLNGPEEESALENILLAALSGISTLKETRNDDPTRRNIEYFPHKPEFSLQQIIPYLESIVNPKKYKKPICTVFEVSGRVRDTGSMEITLNLPIKGYDANRNREIIQNISNAIKHSKARFELAYQT